MKFEVSYVVVGDQGMISIGCVCGVGWIFLENVESFVCLAREIYFGMGS